jgi:hypothetical protein
MKEEGEMQQSSSSSSHNEIMAAINPMIRQLDRLEERTRDIVTRADVEGLRKELVARESLEPQLTSLRVQIERVNVDRLADKLMMEKRLDALDAEQISKQDRLWIRIGQILAIAAFALVLFQFIAHYRFIP